MDKRLLTILAILTAPGGLLMTGCAASYAGPGSRNPAARIVPRRQWELSGNLAHVERAADGSVGSRAVATEADPAPTLTVDFGRPSLFNLVAIEHGGDGMGFARRVQVLTSLDGEQYTPRYSSPGARHVTTLSLITPVFARYVRVRVTEPGDRPWSVGEISFQ
jgi:hypothetical protein